MVPETSMGLVRQNRHGSLSRVVSHYCSGMGSMVLDVSRYVYIFPYDWFSDTDYTR